MATVSGFLTKTFGIFSDQQNEDICGWGPGGDTIQVRKIDEFSKKILPQYFKHANFQSFVRQLNMYDFHKTIQDPGNGEFQHMYFLKDRPDLLHLIKRKAHSRTEGKSKALPLGSSSHETNSASTDIIPHHTETSHFLDSKPRNSRGDLERRMLLPYDDQAQRIQELEAQQAALVSENSVLKRVISDMKYKQEDMSNKTEGILKLLYHMFLTSGGGINIPKGALSNIPEPRLKEFCKYLQIESPLVKRSSFDDTNMISNYSYGSSSVPILHMDTPMIDDFITLDDHLDENGNSTSSQPLRKLFSFDTLAKSVSQPTDSSLVIRSNSLERLVDIDMPPPKPVENLPYQSSSSSSTSSSSPTDRKRSIAIPEDQEGAALTRKATIDANLFSNYEVEEKEATKNGLKKRKFASSEAKEDSTNSSTNFSTPLVRQDAIDYRPAGEQNEEIPMKRLDSMETALASFLSFDPTTSS